LVLIAILGGNFKLFGAEVSEKVENPWLRGVAFTLGVGFLVVAFYLNTMPPAPLSAPTALPANSSPTVVQRITIRGVWRDVNSGAVFQLIQQGDTFEFTAAHPDYRSSGRGTVAGHSFKSEYETRYQNGGISAGTCSGTLSDGGAQISATCTDVVSGTS